MSAASSLGDRWNPILVKEVRASLRGRVFRILFPIVLFGAVIVAMLRLSSLDPANDSNAGRQFVEPIYVMLCVALLGIVPLSAFFSMGGEWEEHTFDLLSISNLRPRHIVWGKLMSAGIEATLYFSAFAPLIVFAFLLRGIDPLTLCVVLGLTYAASFTVVAVALAFSSLARQRVARILVLCVVAAMCFGAILLAYEFADEVMLRSWGPRGLRWRETLSAALFLVAFLFGGVTVACERLAHPEENHSTGPRLLLTVLFVAWIVTWLAMTAGSSRSISFVAEALMVGLFLSAFGHVFFVTEREDLTRRTAHGAPRSRLLAFCAVPFFPGGGRALLLYALHTLLAVSVLFASVSWWRTPSAMNPSDEYAPARVALFGAHFLVYLAFVSWITHRHADKPIVRWVTRLAIPAAVLLLICVPAFASYMFGADGYMDFEHPLNPFTLLSRGSMLPARQSTILVVVTVVVLCVNAPRIARGVTEILRASRSARARRQAE